MMLLAMLAAMLAPAAMPAKAAPVAVEQMAHCEDMAPAQEEESEGERELCCVAACTALPPLGGGVADRAAPRAAPPASLSVAVSLGLTPEAETPPPRLS